MVGAEHVHLERGGAGRAVEGLEVVRRRGAGLQTPRRVDGLTDHAERLVDGEEVRDVWTVGGVAAHGAVHRVKSERREDARIADRGVRGELAAERVTGGADPLEVGDQREGRVRGDPLDAPEEFPHILHVIRVQERGVEVYVDGDEPVRREVVAESVVLRWRELKPMSEQHHGEGAGARVAGIGRVNIDRGAGGRDREDVVEGRGAQGTWKRGIWECVAVAVAVAVTVTVTAAVLATARLLARVA